MKGLVFNGTELVEFRRDLIDPVIVDGKDVIVEVERAGICGSDLHQFHGREPVAPGTIPGHEFVGRIAEVGPLVERFKVGDRVFSPFTTSCGECYFCRAGLSARCEHHFVFGYQPPDGVDDSGRGIQGAQTQWIRVPQADTTLVELPKNIDPEAALLLGDNFSTGFFCADQGMIVAEGITVVLGCGAVGLSAIASAQFLGATTVVAVDQVASRRERAAQLGAIVSDVENAASVVAELATVRGQIGADSVLEAVGNPAAQRMAFELVRPFGVISAVGMHTSEHFSFSPLEAYDHNITYRAGRCPVRSYLDRLVPLVEEGKLRVPTEQIVTHHSVPLEDGVNAYALFSRRDEDCVKVLLDPHSTAG